MKEFFEKIEKKLKNNYWLEPVLLIVLIFALIFVLRGIPSISQTIKGWFSPTQEEVPCPSCTVVTFEEANKHIEEDKECWVLITQETCTSCAKAYPLIEKLLSTNEAIDFFKIDIEKNADEYNDSTITDELLYSFGQLIDVGVTTAGHTSFYDEENDEYVFETPTVMHFENGKATGALIGIPDYAALAEFVGLDD